VLQLLSMLNASISRAFVSTILAVSAEEAALEEDA
jgi:hypothetical protein